MGPYIVRRVIQTIFVAFAALIVVFVLVRLSGDPAALMAGPDASQADVEQIRHSLGLDRPIQVQFVDYLGHAVRGDFGLSLRYGQPALSVVMDHLGATLELTAVGMLLSVLFAVPAGVISATRRDTWADRIVTVGALWGQTLPVFWLGIVLIVIFSVKLGWLPTSGRGGLSHLILPAITLAAFNMARIARLVRSEMLDVISQDFIQVARSKGLAEHTILIRHALKSAAIPVVTIIGLQVGQLLGGAVVTETVFAWPGVGRLMIQAIFFRDFPLVQVAILILALAVTVINLAVDLSYAWLDPRIRYQ